MTALGRAFFDIIPYLLAFAAGAAIPNRNSRLERLAFGAIGLLVLAFVRGLWPGAPTSASHPDEWPHLLNLIVLLPLVAGALLLVLPRK